MINMTEQIIINLTWVGYAMGILSLAWLSNFAFSIYFNIKVVEELFDIKRLINGVEKLVALCVGIGLLSLVITLFPIFMTYVGVPINEEYTTLFSVLTVIILFGNSTIKYTKQAYDTLKQILEK